MFEGLLQPEHLLVILAVVILVFGPKRLPELGRGLGEAIHGFRSGIRLHDGGSDGQSPEQNAGG